MSMSWVYSKEIRQYILEKNVENRIESCLDWQTICEAWMKEFCK